MKTIDYTIKTGITIIITFIIIAFGMILYKPCWWLWYKKVMGHGDIAERENAIRTVIGEGANAVPHLRDWVDSDNPLLVNSVMKVIMQIDNELYIKLEDKVFKVLNGPISENTLIAVSLFYNKAPLVTEKSCDNREPYYYYHFASHGNKGKFRIPNPVRMNPSYSKRTIRNFAIYTLKNAMKPRERKSAAIFIGHYGDPAAFDCLKDSIKSEKHSIVRSGIVQALGNIMDKRSIEIIKKVIADDKSILTRTNAILALEQYVDTKLIDYLHELLTADNSYLIRSSVAELLGKVKSNHSIDILTDSMENDCNPIVRMWAACALGNIGNPNAIEPLISALTRDKSSEVRYCIIRSLVNLRAEDVMNVLFDILLYDPHKDVRWIAGYAIGKLGNDTSVNKLRDLLNKTENIDTSQFIYCALGALGKMPEVFPKYNKKGDLDDELFKDMLKWIHENSQYLYWDEDKNQFVLENK